MTTGSPDGFIDPAKAGGRQPKFCRDCVWCRRSFLDFIISPFDTYQFAKCAHPATQLPASSDQYLVDGRSERQHMMFASTARGSLREVSCGPQGRHWEPKP